MRPSAEAAQDLCARLAAEPLFHLSLTSKELFHSNFLAWLCEAETDRAVELFRRWVPADASRSGTQVHRERHRLDLAVELPGLKPFIIENKVFSPPDEAQLDDQAAGKHAGLDEPAFFLLSLQDPGWRKGLYRSPTGHQWRHLPYADLVTELRQVSRSAGEFERALMTHYAALCELLGELVALGASIHTDDPVLLPDDLAQTFRRARVHDAVGKFRARKVLALLRGAGASGTSTAVRWEALFSRSHPLISAFIPLPSGDQMGWQYQEGQFRLAVITHIHKGRTPEIRAARHLYVSEHYKEFFDFAAVSQLTPHPSDSLPRTEAKGEFNRFDPDFVYRHRKVPSLTVAELARLSAHYLNMIRESFT